ncbi:hypothetical protein, partial [Bradyrhizobium sp. 33ap4]|uniref:hypothetical protein n=1 Tax=Bradyrhizobium sp. 33ap4 TaxID=3061630 RepID=UPI00292E39B5
DLLLRGAEHKQQAMLMDRGTDAEVTPADSDDFFIFECPSPSTSCGNTGAHLDVLMFLYDPRADAAMLHGLPVVRRVFVKYNTSLCPTAPVERLFSLANLMLLPNRRRLDDGIFESCFSYKSQPENAINVFLHCCYFVSV